MTDFQIIQAYARNCWLAGIPLAELARHSSGELARLICQLTEEESTAIYVEYESLTAMPVRSRADRQSPAAGRQGRQGNRLIADRKLTSDFQLAR